MSTSTDFPSARRVPPPPPPAVDLLARARDRVREAEHAAEPVDRFTTAYLGALCAAAAVLAARGRPRRGLVEPAGVWVLLPVPAPGLREWAEYFASCSAVDAAVRAGVTRHVDRRAADDLVRQAAQFIGLADAIVREGGR
ncbi:SAV_6107 family HEPN domain-containing protein [Saccharothrix australiensis]|uniref:SAV-6107-like HEPN domain-containing protein n=1 Tax=Saccharothrix australiensis TaxID=2072 RepID=A0A495VVE0_9PSEU|nr:SAV_6107 family HEPN domain-containing protein [Saccharothrix australiensis]RKT53322.1 hypothetical protein C8E97_1881 [Saccharothrix australiensis]